MDRKLLKLIVESGLYDMVLDKTNGDLTTLNLEEFKQTNQLTVNLLSHIDVSTLYDFMVYIKSEDSHPLIQGEDDRYNEDFLQNAVENARSVAVLIYNRGREDIGAYYKYPSLQFKEFFKDYPLLPEERFENELCLTGVLGVAFIYEDNQTLISAKHCLFSNFLNVKPEEIDIIFDYQIVNGINLDYFPKSEVYFCKDIIKDYQKDIVKLKVNRSINGKKILELSDAENPTKCYGVGYPMKLPRKIAFQGKIEKDPKDEALFLTNLDFFTLNSGSPIFNETDHKIMGMAFWELKTDTKKEIVKGKIHTTFAKNPENSMLIKCYYINQINFKKMDAKIKLTYIFLNNRPTIIIEDCLGPIGGDISERTMFLDALSEYVFEGFLNMNQSPTTYRQTFSNELTIPNTNAISHNGVLTVEIDFGANTIGFSDGNSVAYDPFMKFRLNVTERTYHYEIV